MIFYKTSSFGNDFIEIDREELAGRSVDCAVLARAICDRQRGVGADGIVVYRAGKRGARFRIFNRDGGEAELSGNGMAGLAAVLFQRRLAVSPLALRAAIGSRRIELLGREGAVFRLAVEIGLPDFSRRDFFPFLKDGRDAYPIDGLEFHPVSVGNPHAVVIGREMPSGEQLAALGRKLEGHGMFPKRVNVEFVQPTSTARCRVYFYERGVGPTLASSTGSAAVFAVLRRLGMAQDHLDIEPGAASTAPDPAGGEIGRHAAGHSAGSGNDAIRVSWREGIFIRNFTRLVCRGEYFL